jgi:acyl carrier protein
MTVNDLVASIVQRFDVRLPIGPDTPLFSTGLIDSLDFSTMLSMLETEFKVSFDLADVGYDNFDTPAQIFEMLRHARPDL